MRQRLPWPTWERRWEAARLRCTALLHSAATRPHRTPMPRSTRPCHTDPPQRGEGAQPTCHTALTHSPSGTVLAHAIPARSPSYHLEDTIAPARASAGARSPPRPGARRCSMANLARDPSPRPENTTTPAQTSDGARPPPRPGPRRCSTAAPAYCRCGTITTTRTYHARLGPQMCTAPPPTRSPVVALGHYRQAPAAWPAAPTSAPR